MPKVCQLFLAYINREFRRQQETEKNLRIGLATLDELPCIQKIKLPRSPDSYPAYFLWHPMTSAYALWAAVTGRDNVYSGIIPNKIKRELS
ncbi:hypothetical protein J4212_03440 [Candidatus Woesearchaeota archaeon]|nr:hypothetical protein [Candidatus Woesearchaeota archaeon]